MVRNNMMKRILDGLTKDQAAAVRSDKRRLLVVAGAALVKQRSWHAGLPGGGCRESSKREYCCVYVYRKAAEEMKFRIRY